MKKVVFILSLLVLCFTLSIHAQFSKTINLDVSELSYDTLFGYDLLQLDQGYFTDIPGEPKIPYFKQRFVIPRDADITQFTFDDSTSILLDGTYYIFPAQQPAILDGRPSPPFAFPDSVTYQSNNPYPGNLIELDETGILCGYKVVTLKIYPVQYKPLIQKIRFYTSISFTIDYQLYEVSDLPERITMNQYNSSSGYIKKIVENPEEVEGYGPIAEEIIPDPEGTRFLVLDFLPYLGSDNIQYLIITSDEYKTHFQPLADWKTKKGIPALVVTTSQIATYYPGFDLAEKIFNYLKDVYLNWGADIYVLLGGDTDISTNKTRN